VLAKHTLWSAAALLLAVAGTSPSYAVSGFAEVGPGAGDLANNCANNPGVSLDQIVYACTVAVESTAWHGTAWPYVFRAQAYEQMHKDDLALADLDSAIKVARRHDPLLPLAYHDRCVMRARNGQNLGDALSDCNHSLEIKPNDVSTLESRAAVEYELADYQAVSADCSAALAAQPNDAFAADLLDRAKQKMAGPAGAAQSAK
jgi:tetratricopeptide (TPR) repeat protein